MLSLDRKMCHCLYYPAGLNGQVGDLLLMPGEPDRTAPNGSARTDGSRSHPPNSA